MSLVYDPCRRAIECATKITIDSREDEPLDEIVELISATFGRTPKSVRAEIAQLVEEHKSEQARYAHQDGECGGVSDDCRMCHGEAWGDYESSKGDARA